MKRDFGPMLTAERRARLTGKTLRPDSKPLSGKEITDVEPPDGISRRWYNAALPILTLIVTTMLGIYFSGLSAIEAKSGAEAAMSASLGTIAGSGDSFSALMWAAITSSIVAIGLVVVQRILTLEESVMTWVNGAKGMTYALIILSLAWALSAVIGELKTAEALTALTSHILKPEFMPFIVFLLACITSFATGTSWGTMAILFPLIIPLLHDLSVLHAMPPEAFYNNLVATSGAILTGAIFGDHCSPISDTTILSSICSAVDHIDHVKTQAVYAIVIAVISALVGYLPAGYGFSPYLSLAIGVVMIVLVLFIVGRDPNKLDVVKQEDPAIIAETQVD